ncbi:MAG: polysaccharide pyruvyl transferase family protein [Variovorax sp.]|nr:MAG: polysaccharide pyruvyl transferase family protein [Variovorax sp.]
MRMKTVLLPGDFVNLGDAMLSLAAGRRIMQDGRQCILMPYKTPSDKIRKEFETAGLKIVSIRANPARAFKACLRSSIRIGGGHAIRNEVSLGWLSFTVAICFWAVVCGHCTAVVGAGATSIRSRWKKFCFQLIFDRCTEINLRDAVSLDLLKAEFPASAVKMKKTGDLAFLKGCLSLRPDLHASDTCLVSPGIDSGESRNEDPKEILRALRRLHEQEGLKRVLIVSHDLREDFGLSFCRTLGATIGRELPVEVRLIASDGVADGLLAPYGQAHWIITGRLHGLIIGALQSREVIYTRGSAGKLKPFADLFGFGSVDEPGRTHEADARRPLRDASLTTQQRAAELNFAVR